MLTIIVPTLNEAENLPELNARVSAALAGVDYELVIVDDSSDDGTEDVVRSLSAQYPVRMISRAGKPRDLSWSVIDGIEAATSSTVLVMDADLSHPPERIPAMLARLKETPGAFVIGSRYVEGGTFDREWSVWRFLNSTFATVLARPLVKCNDPMSGFFLFNRDRLGDRAKLRPIGYKIGLELMVRGNFDAIVEVPIEFADRARGESKMTLAQQFNYLRHLRRLYLRKFGGVAEFIHFGAVGASGFVIDVAVYYLVQGFGAPHQVARAISFWPAVSWNWAINRRMTFGDRRKRPRAKQWFEFVGMSIVGFTINWGVYYFLTMRVAFFDHYRILALVSGVGVASVFNFAASTVFVYSDNRR